MSTVQYFAGLFDGEGCIQITKDAPRKACHNPTFKLDIRIGMIDRRPLDAIQAFAGGGTVYNSHPPRPGHSRLWTFVANGKIAEDFLRAIQPHSIVKAEEIAVAIEYRDWVSRHPSPRKAGVIGSLPHPPEEIEKRENFRSRLRALKRRFRVHQ